MKTQRHAAILKIVRSERVASQEELRELLKAEGFDVTQATLSRDIRELGLAKVGATDGGSHYAPPLDGPQAMRPHLEQLLPTHLVSVDGVGPLVVVKTPAGGAQALGLALDAAACPAIGPWLRERYGARVVCFAADVGQGAGELDGLVEKAERSGAAGCVIEDLREEFVRDFVFPTLRAGAVYARTYLLGTAMARPVMAAHQVARAERVGAQALAHGCTGKGNDQVGCERAYAALAPDLQVIAPWREWQFKGREDLIAYVKAKGIPGIGR